MACFLDKHRDNFTRFALNSTQFQIFVFWVGVSTSHLNVHVKYQCLHKVLLVTRYQYISLLQDLRFSW